MTETSITREEDSTNTGTLSSEGWERLLNAVVPCHPEPDPTCLRCSLDMIAEAVQMLLARHTSVAYAEWPDGDFRHLQRIVKFLEERE